MPSSNSLWIGRLKLVLIPALALVLLVLVWPTRKSEQQTLNLAVSLPPLQPSNNVTANLSTSAVEVDWSAIDLDLAGVRNPFGPMEATAKSQAPAITPLATSAPLTTTDTSAVGERNAAPLNVQAIHEIAGTRCALVGDKLLKVGDTLADGRRIVAITPAGLVLESN